MRIAMLSCNTGEGHNSTARAIQAVLEDRGVETELIDVLACLSPRISKFICNWHARLYKYAPKLWDVGYRAVEKKEQRSDEGAMLSELLSLGANKLKVILEKGNYDAAVCPHVFSAMMMTELRRTAGNTLPCYFVGTDYTCYPYVDCCDLDGYFIPAADLVPLHVKVGIPEEKLHPCGIPVRQEFYSRSARGLAREKLDIHSDSTAILLMCGSMGCGPMRKITRELTEKLPENSLLVAVCGKNEKLYSALSSIKSEKLRVLGFTNQIHEYMDAVDMIVTKPGGLSATESANKRVPMVFINAIGGCENHNFNFFLEKGYAVGSTQTTQVIQQTLDLAADPQTRREMAQRLEESFTCNSTRYISDLVMEAANRYRTGSKSIDSDPNGNPLDKEGGFTMNQQNNETIQNLARSFAGESQARTRYTIYAQVARGEGLEWIARVFEETAANEAVHAEEFLEMLKALGGCADKINIAAGYPYPLGDTLENLTSAATGELHEHDEAYPGFAEMARREGFDDAARLWLQIARIEGVHHNTFSQLKEQLAGGTLHKKEKAIVWQCANCGYTYEGPNACDPCPVCKKSAGWQMGDVNRKLLMPKK